MTFFKRREKKEKKEKKVGSARRDTTEISLFLHSSSVARARHNTRQGYLRNTRHANEYIVCAFVREISYEARFRTVSLHCLSLCVYIASDTWKTDERVACNYKEIMIDALTCH